jgi:ABC-2 type transport system permease protein
VGLAAGAGATVDVGGPGAGAAGVVGEGGQGDAQAFVAGPAEARNGLVLSVAAMTLTLALLLPLAVAMAAADAIPDETTHGPLRGLLIAPVGGCGWS